jgi:MFS family permease
MLLLLSLQFQLILGESPLQAGIRILPFEVAFLAVGPLSGTLSDRFGHSKFTLSGLVLGTIGLFLFSTTVQGTPYVVLSGYMVLMGVATGLFLAPNLRSVMGSLPYQRRGIGSALVSLFLNIGLSVSLNFAILVMSLTAPYSLITQLISSVSPLSVTAAQKLVFMDAIKNTYLAIAIVNGLAILPSAFQLTGKKGEENMLAKVGAPALSVDEPM